MTRSMSRAETPGEAIGSIGRDPKTTSKAERGLVIACACSMESRPIAKGLEGSRGAYDEVFARLPTCSTRGPAGAIGYTAADPAIT